MFAVVLQQEHKKLAVKTAKKSKQNKSCWKSQGTAPTKKMLIDLMTVSTMDKVDSPSNKLMDKMDKNKTYQSRIKNLGPITNED
jgi:hypothetical protein